MREAKVAAKERTAVTIAKKSREEIGIVFMGDAEILGPDESTGTGGIEGVSGSVAEGAVDARMWGSSIGTAGGG